MSAQYKGNPYQVLGIAPDASDTELRSAYRRLVQIHHPDHNGGSAESTARFAQIQAAYAHVVGMRRGTIVPPATPKPGGTSPADPAVQRRIDEMERELARTRAARARTARPAASRPAVPPPRRRPTREELGYFDTDDSFTRIIDDAAEDLGARWERSAKKPLTRRLLDLLSRGD